MSYLSQYTGAQVDALLDKCNELPTMEELSSAFAELQDADLSSLSTSATADTRTVRAVLANGIGKSVTIPAATSSAAGMMSGADKSLLSELNERLALTAPLYMEGAMYVAGAGFLAGAELLGTTGTEQLNASSTGNKKKAYDRFMKNVPCCVLVPVASSASTSSVAVSCIPFMLEESVSRLVSGYRIVLKYRSAMVLTPGYYTDINIVVTSSNKTVSIGFDTTAIPTVEENSSMLPFITEYFTITADGSISPSSSATYSSSSTGELKKLYDRIQKGFPPAIGVRMTNSDGSSSLVWAYPSEVTASGKNTIYKSNTIANGSFSGKTLRVNLLTNRIQCAMST